MGAENWLPYVASNIIQTFLQLPEGVALKWGGKPVGGFKSTVPAI